MRLCHERAAMPRQLLGVPCPATSSSALVVGWSAVSRRQPENAGLLHRFSDMTPPSIGDTTDAPPAAPG